MSNYSASVYKYNTKKGSKYYVKYSYISPVTNKRTRTTQRGFDLKREAEQWIRDNLAKKICQLEQNGALSETLTMEELIDEYLNDFQNNPKTQDTTFENKSSLIKKHVLPYWGNKLVHHITSNDVRIWQNQLLASRKPDGEPFTDTYLRTIENQLSAIFNFAVAYYELAKNPIQKRIGSKTASERPIWELSDYNIFMKQIEYSPEYYYAFELLFWTGMRLGELQALLPSDFDFEAKTVSITKAWKVVGGVGRFGPTKTPSSTRRVYLPDFLIYDIKDYLDSIKYLSTDTRIFPLSKSRMHSYLDSGIANSNVPDITIHGFRHSHASLLENMGIPRVLTKVRLGHKRQGRDITDNYTHPYDSASLKVAEVLNDLHDGKLEVWSPFMQMFKM